jgi:aconitate hydratase
LTNRSEEKLKMIEHGLRSQGLLKDYNKDEPIQYTSVLELKLDEVEPAMSGPKRPHDRVPLSKLKEDWNTSLTAKVGFKGFGLTPEKAN